MAVKILQTVQGWMGKTQPSLTHPVITSFYQTEKPTKVGKIGFYLFFLQDFRVEAKFFQKKMVKHTSKICQNLFQIWINWRCKTSIVHLMQNYLLIFQIWFFNSEST